MKKTITLLLVWILIIEGSLHLTALGVQLWMRPPEKAYQDDRSIKVLAIGESTTVWGGEDAYPGFLQRKLDAKFGAGVYSVINRGLPGANTHRVLRELPGILDETLPDIAIVMSGINDYWATIDQDASLWQIYLEKFSRYSMLAKLIRNTQVNIEYGKKSDEDMSRAGDCGGHNTEIDKFIAEAEKIKTSGDIKKTADYLEKQVAIVTPNGTCSIADRLQLMLISLQENELNNPELALATIEKFLKFNMIPYKRSAFLIKRNELRARLGLSIDNKTQISAENYWENSTYKINIQHIIGQIQGRGIPVIMMQYPRLPIGPLQTILINHTGVSFVENKAKFEAVLKSKTFDDLFYDKFAGIFGHFKPLGSELVAEEVMNEVIKRTETQANARVSKK